MYDFTIITVCYNSEKTIDQTIMSVFNQKEKIQYLIIDGLSSDNTLNIAHRYKNISPENIDMEIYSERDAGIYNAMNKGILKATGKLIGIINSDDLLIDNALNIVSKTFDNEDVDAIHSNVLWKYDINGKNYFQERKGLADLSYLHDGMTINHPTLFCKKNVYDKLGLFDETYRYVADWVFCLKFIDSSIKLRYLDELLVIFSMDGVSNRFLLSRYKEIGRVYNDSFFNRNKLTTFQWSKNWARLILEGIKSYVLINVLPVLVLNKIRSFKKSKLIKKEIV